MSIFFLDDSEERIKAAVKHFQGEELFIERTASEAINTLDRIGDWELVMLDHDLGGEAFVDSNRPDTGMEVVRWIIKSRPKIKRIVVHSWNAPAAKNMVGMLNNAGYKTTYEPFSGKGADMPQEEVKFPEGSRIIPINPAARYAVLVPKDTDPETINELADFLADWWDSGNPFVVMTNEIVLVKVGEVDTIEEESNGEEKET